MSPTSSLFRGIAVVLAIGLSTGCDTVIHGSAKVTGGTHRQVKYDIQLGGGFSFLHPGGSHPVYSLVVDGYPYNRLLVEASYVSNSPDPVTDQSTVTPMQLAVGTQIPMSVSVGPDVYTYTAVLTYVSSLPQGTYLIDAPGAVEDVQASLESYPGAAIQINLPGLGSGANKPLPSAGTTYVDGDTGSTSVLVDMEPTQALYWYQVQTTRLPKPGVQTPF